MDLENSGQTLPGAAAVTHDAIKTEGDHAQRAAKPKVRSRKKDASAGADDPSKRRCVSTACIACRRRKSKCDGNLPACAACASVYNTECVYDPNSDHRRKGVYKKDIDKLKTRNSTLEVLIHAILNVPEQEVPDLIKRIRTCESLDAVAEGILAKEAGIEEDDEDLVADRLSVQSPTFETQLSGKMGELRLEDGSTRYIGGTSNLLFLSNDDDRHNIADAALLEHYPSEDSIITSWTNVTDDAELVTHLLNMYFTWHYTFFTTLSKTLFFRDFKLGKPHGETDRKYCTSLLVNAMLALGCHFTSWRAAREDPDDSATTGDHFFREAKRLIMEDDEHEKPKLTNVQALALMSVREAGCGREAKGWVYSGMSFRMACDLGLNLDSGAISGGRDSNLDDDDVDARRVTFWGCFLFDKCWSNYLGRLPQLPPGIINVPKFEIWPGEESEIWAAYTDSGVNQSHAQPSRTRAVSLQISALCEISSDLMSYFYNPMDIDKSKGKQSELKKLSEIHQRLETWRRNLPPELEPKEGGLPSMLVMHMFFQLLYIHLFRPFLKYSQATSPLPPNVSPRRLCTQAAAAISKLLRLYKRSHGLRQIPNVVVYIGHNACTVHLLNLPDKNARRDITHGVKHMEEIAESWLCARRTLAILSHLAKKWGADLPEEAATVLARTDMKFRAWSGETQIRNPSNKADSASPQSTAGAQQTTPRAATLQFPQPSLYTSPQVPTITADAFAASRRVSTSVSLPPSSAYDYKRMPQQPPQHPSVSAASPPLPPTARSSMDSQAAFTRTPTTTKDSPAALATNNSPSALFGGVEQLLREGQDWWLRDQSQLAIGFEQWPHLPDAQESAGWINGSAPAMTSAVTTSAPCALAALSNGWNGGILDGMNLDLGSGLDGINRYPNEDEWYQ